MKALINNKSNAKSPNYFLAKAYFQKVEALNKQEKHKEALVLLEEANTALLEEGKDKDVLRARILHLMSDGYLNKDAYQKAITCNQEAYDIQIELLGAAAEATLASRLLRGLIGERLGEYRSALEDLLETLDLYNTTEHTDSEEYAILHYAIGRCYSRVRDFWKSVLYLQKAAQIFEGLKETAPLWRPILYSAIGTSYSHAKDSKQALYYYEEALGELLESVGELHRYTSMVYTNIGLDHYRNKKFFEAIPYLQKSVEILENLGEINSLQLFDTYTLIGANYSSAGEFTKSQYYLQKGLELGHQIYANQPPKIAQIHLMTASMHEKKEEYLLALNACQQGLMACISSFNDENVYHYPPLKDIHTDDLCIPLLSRKAIIFQKYYLKQKSEVKNIKAALECIDLVSQAVEQVHYHTDQSKLSVKGYYADIYEASLNIRYLAWEKLNDPNALETAFSAAEKAKAALLLSAMKDETAKLKSPIPSALLEQKQGLMLKLTQLDKKLQAQRTQEGSAASKESKIQTLQAELLGYHRQYDELMEQLAKDYPDYYQLKYHNQTASIAQIQGLLQSQELLIHYSLHEETLFIFAISSSSVSFKKIARSKKLEHNIEAFEKTMFLGDLEEYGQLAGELYEELLTPVEAELKGKNKLLIIPDGVLQRLPFDALISPFKTSIETFSELPYLIKNFAIQYHYSATLLWYAHQKSNSISNKSKDNFLGLAPIKFGYSDFTNCGYMLKSGKNGKKDRKLILKSGENNQDALMDLEETETEVKTVYELFETQEKEAMALFYDMASKENLLKHIEGYKYILLSTHGFSDTEHSALSGLNLYTDNKLDDISSEEAKLYISDIMNLQLSADFVVLSSCESGVGKLQQGEGMMALHRAFLYAGVQNIVYSLFKVRQDSTSLLVQAMFRHILGGDSYSTALRKAKLQLIEDEVMEPIDWAGFALIGV
ncbi:MAG: CHAT domain-containing tetratricopeptide repeat protein [Chitinophagales bacterium]